jgi:hypothetical protein
VHWLGLLTQQVLQTWTLTQGFRIGNPPLFSTTTFEMASPTPINCVFQWMLDEQDPVEEMMDFLTNSNEEVNLHPKNTRGPSKDCRRFEGDQKLHKDYFAGEPVYGNQDFKRRFQITKSLFLKIRNKIAEHDPYFLQKQVSFLFCFFLFFFFFLFPSPTAKQWFILQDCTGLFDLSTKQKLTSSLKILG